MTLKYDDDTQVYKVLVNIEEQYGLWPIFRKDIPWGWRETGVTGSKEECGIYIKEVWTDMRPLSLRKQMNESEDKQNVPFESSNL